MEKLSSGTMLISRVKGMRVWTNHAPPHLTLRKSKLSLTAIHILFLTCISLKSGLCSQNWGSLGRATRLSHSVPESTEEKEVSFSLPCPDLPPCYTNWSTKYKIWMIMVIGKSIYNYYFPCISVHIMKRQSLFLRFLNLVGVCFDQQNEAEVTRCPCWAPQGLVPCPSSLSCRRLPPLCDHHMIPVWSLCDQVWAHLLEDNRSHRTEMSHPSWGNTRWYSGVRDIGQGTSKPKRLIISVPWNIARVTEAQGNHYPSLHVPGVSQDMGISGLKSQSLRWTRTTWSCYGNHELVHELHGITWEELERARKVGCLTQEHTVNSFIPFLHLIIYSMSLKFTVLWHGCFSTGEEDLIIIYIIKK